jgi:hypothetical protein
VNRYLLRWGYDKTTLTRQPPAVRFQAEHSNDCRQFDLSPSDLKHIKEPPWLRPDRAAPTLMLFSVVGLNNKPTLILRRKIPNLSHRLRGAFND